MAEERLHRRRRRRRRRDGADSAAVIPEQEAPAPDRPAPPDWRWRTFPVLFAFAVGAFSFALVALVIRGSFLTLFYVALFGVAFGLAHIVTRTVVRRR